LGDLGGLYDALFFIGYLTVSKIGMVAFNKEMLEQIFISRSNKTENRRLSIAIRNNLSADKE